MDPSDGTELARLRAENDRLRAERADAEQRLRAEIALRDRVLETIPVAVAYYDLDLTYRLSNPLGDAITGIPKEQKLGRRYRDVQPQNADETEARFRHVLETRESSGYEGRAFPTWRAGEVVTRHYDGSLHAVIGEDGEPIGVLAVAADVTERVERARADQERIAALERADRLKDEFLGVVSHELRTPIHVIMGYLDLLQRLPAAPNGGEWLQRIRQQAEALGAIINAVLDFSQAEAGFLALAPAAIAPGPFMAEAAGRLVDLAAAKGVALAIDVPPDLPEIVCDPLRVAQVLGNLLDNAVKFTPAGGQVVMRARAAGAGLRVEVADSGAGIPPAHHDRIFGRFVQVDMGLTRAAGGVGLGLAIARQLVEAHGGTIGFASEPGRGSAFWFELPAGKV